MPPVVYDVNVLRIFTAAIAAVVARSSLAVCFGAMHALPRSHPVRTYVLAHKTSNSVIPGLYAALPTWALQAARATLLLLIGALLYCIFFRLANFPLWLGIDQDPILHHHLHPYRDLYLEQHGYLPAGYP